MSPGKAKGEGLGTLPHVMLPLLGRFKARAQEVSQRLTPIAWQTRSGLEPGVWTERLITVLEQCGRLDGWVFCDWHEMEEQRAMGSFEEEVFGMLTKVQVEHPEIIPEEVDVADVYGLARSARRGATTRGQEAGVSA